MYFLIATIRAAAKDSVFFVVEMFEITIDLNPCVLISAITFSKAFLSTIDREVLMLVAPTRRVTSNGALWVKSASTLWLAVKSPPLETTSITALGPKTFATKQLVIVVEQTLLPDE